MTSNDIKIKVEEKVKAGHIQVIMAVFAELQRRHHHCNGYDVNRCSCNYCESVRKYVIKKKITHQFEKFLNSDYTYKYDDFDTLNSKLRQKKLEVLGLRKRKNETKNEVLF